MFIGVDCGTQSTKVVVMDMDQGLAVGEASRPHSLHTGPGGRQEQDPADWLGAFRAALHAAIETAGVAPDSIRAIGVSGQQHGLVALDESGAPVYPAKLWCDTETAQHNAALSECLGGETGCLDKLGLTLQTGYTASKLAWLRDSHPDAYQRIHSVMLPHDYLNFWLTGERVSEAGDASGTGYFDTRSRNWHKEVFATIAPELDPDTVLPRLIDSRQPVGRIRPEVAFDLGLNKAVIVSSGGGDNMMGAIGTGNIRTGIVTMSLGTSGTLCAHSADPLVASDAQVANFCASHSGWLPLICTMNVTSATKRIRELFGLDLEAFNHQVAIAPPGAEGVTVAPFFNGERVPPLPLATASFHGLTGSNTRQANLCRAVVEGATFGLRYGLERLGELAHHASEIRLVGGGAKSPIWRQMAADILDLPVVCPTHTDAAALGAAIQAAWCCQQGSLSELCDRMVHLDESTRAQPDTPAVMAYHEAYERYQRIVKTHSREPRTS